MLLRVLDEDLYPEGLEPAHIGDAGLDLRVREGAYAPWGGEVLKLPLGVAMDVGSADRYGLVTARSSTLLKTGLLVQDGIIDSGYRGEVHLIAYATRAVGVERGDRLCQLIAVEIKNPYHWDVVDALPGGTSRGVAGFGSTGLD